MMMMMMIMVMVMMMMMMMASPKHCNLHEVASNNQHGKSVLETNAMLTIVPRVMGEILSISFLTAALWGATASLASPGAPLSNCWRYPGNSGDKLTVEQS